MQLSRGVFLGTAGRVAAAILYTNLTRKKRDCSYTLERKPCVIRYDQMNIGALARGYSPYRFVVSHTHYGLHGTGYGISKFCDTTTCLLERIHFPVCTGISSPSRAKLRDWAVRPARAGCYSQAALILIDSNT